MRNTFHVYTPRGPVKVLGLGPTTQQVARAIRRGEERRVARENAAVRDFVRQQQDRPFGRGLPIIPR